jgi:hypothetical protein
MAVVCVRETEGRCRQREGDAEIEWVSEVRDTGRDEKEVSE